MNIFPNVLFAVFFKNVRIYVLFHFYSAKQIATK